MATALSSEAGAGSREGNASMQEQAKPAAFLDRDGVLNHDRPDHVKTPGELAVIAGAPAPDAPATLATLATLGGPR